MSDIVERLRGIRHDDPYGEDAIEAAAAEITRLRAALAAAQEREQRMREALNQSRLAFAGYVSAQSAVSLIDALGELQ